MERCYSLRREGNQAVLWALDDRFTKTKRQFCSVMESRTEETTNGLKLERKIGLVSAVGFIVSDMIGMLEAQNV